MGSHHYIRIRGIVTRVAKGLMAATLVLIGVTVANVPSRGLADGNAPCYANCKGSFQVTPLNPVGRTVGLFCLQQCGYQPEIDYKCVSLCASQGATSTHACLQQCSSYPEEKLAQTHSDTAPANNQFTSMQAWNDIVMQPPPLGIPGTPKAKLSPTTAPLSPSTNYKLLKQCLQAGLTFSYCMSASRY